MILHEIVVVDGWELRAQTLASTLSSSVLKARVTTVRDLSGYVPPQGMHVIMVLRADLEPGDGILLCKKLRSSSIDSHLSLLLIVKDGDKISLLRAFEAGADDCVESSISAEELVARLGSLIRRSSGNPLPTRTVSQLLQTPIDPPIALAISSQLTRTEERLLGEFLKAPGKFLSLQELAASVWTDTSLSPKTVEAHIVNLRGKLATTGLQIENRYGRGYRLASKNEQ